MESRDWAPIFLAQLTVYDIWNAFASDAPMLT
ncbi:hypothetical protein ACVIGV_005322 [Rhizobium leguminosarum]